MLGDWEDPGGGGRVSQSWILSPGAIMSSVTLPTFDLSNAWFPQLENELLVATLWLRERRGGRNEDKQHIQTPAELREELLCC